MDFNSSMVIHTIWFIIMDEDTNDNVDVSEQFEGDEVILPTF